MTLACYLKILYFINRNKKNVEYLFLQNNRHKTEVNVDGKTVRIEKKGASAQGHLYYPETFCLNCNLCPKKACSVSLIEQSKIARSVLLPYIYSKMELIHIARNEAYVRQK